LTVAEQRDEVGLYTPYGVRVSSQRNSNTPTDKRNRLLTVRPPVAVKSTGLNRFKCATRHRVESRDTAEYANHYCRAKRMRRRDGNGAYRSSCCTISIIMKLNQTTVVMAHACFVEGPGRWGRCIGGSTGACDVVGRQRAWRGRRQWRHAATVYDSNSIRTQSKNDTRVAQFVVKRYARP